MSQNRCLVWDAESTRTLSIVATLLACFALIWSWALVGLSVLHAEEPISVRGIVACLASAVAGIGAGVLLAGFAAWYYRRRRRALPPPWQNMGLFSLFMGLAIVGSGMESALQPAPTTGWALVWLLYFSVVGGALIGFALVFLGGRGKTDVVAGGVPGQYGAGPGGR